MSWLGNLVQGGIDTVGKGLISGYVPKTNGTYVGQPTNTFSGTLPDGHQWQGQATNYNDAYNNAYDQYAAYNLKNKIGPQSLPPTANNTPSGNANVVSGGAGTTSGLSASDRAYLQQQAQDLQSLLGHLDTRYGNQKTALEDQYNTQVGTATQSRDKQASEQKQARTSTLDTIRQNANTGYNSLAQIIGRSAGRGSSAFRDLLPNVVGKDTASQTQNASQTYGKNLSEIDNSYASALQDLLKQKKQNQSSLDQGYQENRQSLLGQQQQNAGAQAENGGYAAVQAAISPYRNQIEQSRTAVDNLFNQYRTPYTPLAQDPKLAEYTTDRATINAGQQGVADPTNPYTAILKKQLREK